MELQDLFQLSCSSFLMSQSKQYIIMMTSRPRLTRRPVRPQNTLLFLISKHYTFLLTSVQVILVSYCCLFSVRSKNMLHVSIGTFSQKIHVLTSRCQAFDLQSHLNKSHELELGPGQQLGSGPRQWLGLGPGQQLRLGLGQQLHGVQYYNLLSMVSNQQRQLYTRVPALALHDFLLVEAALHTRTCSSSTWFPTSRGSSAHRNLLQLYMISYQQRQLYTQEPALALHGFLLVEAALHTRTCSSSTWFPTSRGSSTHRNLLQLYMISYQQRQLYTQEPALALHGFLLVEAALHTGTCSSST